MAFSLDKFVVSFNIVGLQDGERSKPVEFLPVGADIAAQRAQLDTDIAEWLAEFNATNANDDSDGVSLAFVTNYTISEKWYETTNVPTAQDGANVYSEIQISCRLENSADSYFTNIPAPSSRMFVGNSFQNKVVDTADAALLAYLDIYTAGGGNCAISDGQQFQNPVNITGARLRSVRSGKSY